MVPLRRLALLLFVLGSVQARATTYVVPPDQAMIARADAIVIGRALDSHVEESPERGIETVTVFAVEEVLEGDDSLNRGVRLRTPGGAIETDAGEQRITIVPGVPRFVDGERVLLLLKRVGDGDYATTDFALGRFQFTADEAGRRLLVRDEAEIVGWDLDGSPHREPRRDEDRFLAFIRDVVQHRPASADYVVEASALSRASSVGPPAASNVALTVTQYVFASTSVETSQGSRWNGFPAAVNWNRGNTEINAANGGSTVVSSAFGSWNGDAASSVNYVLASATANSNGIFDSADGVNNIVFEKDMTFRGVAAFNCSTGGVLGSGGLHQAVSDPTNVVNGELFYRIVEGDVSMNAGVGSCLPGGTGTLSVGSFTTAVTHEFGHSLSFRHSSKSRNGTQDCVNMPGYDCSSTALMNHQLVSGLNGALTAWDQRAVQAVYPAPIAPTAVVAGATSASSVSLTWTAAPGALGYNIYRSTDNVTFASAGSSATNAFTDTTVADTAYLYRVTTTAWGVESPPSGRDLATTTVFTSTLIAGTTPIAASDLTELRTAVNAVRKLANAGLANDFNFSDATVTAGETAVKAIHLLDLRTALDAARANLGLSALSYTDPSLDGQPIRALHVQELRDGVR